MSKITPVLFSLRGVATKKNMKDVPKEKVAELESVRKFLKDADKDCQKALLSSEPVPLDKSGIEFTVAKAITLQKSIIAFASGMGAIDGKGA